MRATSKFFCLVFRTLACVAALRLGLPDSQAHAASARLVADLNPAPTDSTPAGGLVVAYAALGKRVLFSSSEERYGAATIWSTDGTPNGTQPLVSGGPLGGAELLGATASLAFFAAAPNGDGSLDLWRTDGSKNGTYPVLARYRTDVSGYNERSTAAALGRFFFQHCRREDGTCDLWVSDGTEAGTVQLAAGYDKPAVLRALGGHLYFLKRGSAGELWRTDGTVGGTVKVASTVAFADGALDVVSSRLLFGNLHELWSSDGTAAGTKRIGSFGGFLNLLSSKVLEGTAYFLATQGGASNLWRSDGTTAGTVQVTDFGIADPLPLVLARQGSSLFFIAKDAGGAARLWASLGTTKTTHVFANCGGQCPEALDYGFVGRLGTAVLFTAKAGAAGAALWSIPGSGQPAVRLGTLSTQKAIATEFVTVGNRGYLLADDGPAVWNNLWTTDGTPAGTRKLVGFKFGGSGLAAAPNLGRILFAANDGVHSFQTWTSDGLPEGTVPLTATSQGQGSYPSGMVALAERVAFWACAGGAALWGANAQGAETLAPLTFGCPPSGAPPAVIPVGGRGYFFVSPFASHSELWLTDGTAAGTAKLLSFDGAEGEIAAFQGKAWFWTFSSYPGEQTTFWRTDGTVAGTQQVFSLPAGSGQPNSLRALGNELYFIAAHELWRSDGTLAGTRQLTHLEDPFAFVSPPELTRVGGAVYFSQNGELWTTDGTQANTRRSISAGPDGARSGASWLIEFGGALLFSGDTAGGGRGLWRTDGSEAGTTLVAAIRPAGEVASRSAARFAGALYFAADETEHGVELWRSDGTPAGTSLVKDIANGWPSASPANLVAAGDRLFFTANDLSHGAELWQSDGTAQGTHMVQDIAPGAFSSTPQYSALAGDQLFFSADDGIQGRELWALPLASALPPCAASPGRLCLGGGRYQVEALWRDFQGHTGRGTAVALTADTGYFWFFEPTNVEVVLKVLDGSGLNGHRWVFYGALSSVEYSLTVTDTQTGAARRYVNPPGSLASVGDTSAFGPNGATPSTLSAGPRGASYAPRIEASRQAAAGICVASATRLCVSAGRFALEVAWKDFQGHTGVGTAVSLTGDTGYFWFFDPANVEVVAKVLDGRSLNDKFWVFYGALSSVEYTLTVTDTQTGAQKQYKNPAGRLASVADTGAF